VIVPKSHDGAFTVIFGDLLESQIQVFLTRGVRRIGRTHLEVFGCHDSVMISEDDTENKSEKIFAPFSAFPGRSFLRQPISTT
jgi:hypothetical protein